MTSQAQIRRFAVRPTFDKNLPYGAWWPRNRTLSDHLGDLFAAWPPPAGRIVRVLYSPTDRDDRPPTVAVTGRGLKTGSFPCDDTRALSLTHRDGGRRGASREEQPVWDNEGGHTPSDFVAPDASAHAVVPPVVS